MKTKIYLGGTSEIQSINTKKIVITFTSGASVDNILQFSYFPFWPSTTNTPRVSLFKTTRVFSGEVTINSDPIQQAINYVTAFNLDYNSVGQFTVTRVDNVVTIIATNDSDLTEPDIIGSFATIVNPLETTIFDEYNLIDLFEDENISFTSKLSDIEKLSNVFTDFTNSFTIPATSNNNDLFKHYYDVDIDNTFNANIRVLAYLEIDTFPLRYGKLQLENIQLKDGRPDSYKITFYGGLLQVTDLFGDDTLQELDFKRDEFDNLVKTWDSISQFDYEYNSGNFINSINLPTFKDSNVITPLIGYADRDWNYGTNDSTDISKTTSPILDTELRPALKIARLFDAIETKYNIQFTREFLDKAFFNNLYMWLNRRTENLIGNREQFVFTSPLTGTPNAGNVTLVDNLLSVTRRKESLVDVDYYVSVVQYIITVSNPAAKYTTYITNDKDANIKVDANINGNVTINVVRRSQEVLDPEIGALVTDKYKFYIESQENNTFNVKIRVSYSRYDYGGPTTPSGFTDFTIVTSDPNLNSIISFMIIKDNIPNIKVIDFVQTIMKMFKLIIRPVTGNIFYLNSLNGYYSDGNILDITRYVNNEKVQIERPLIYKTLKFKYSKTENVAGKAFRDTNDPIRNELGYGDLRTVYNTIDSKDNLTVELPFENMLFERLQVLPPNVNAGELTNIAIGQSSSLSGTTLSKNSSKPILFFNNGLVNLDPFPIKVKFASTTANVQYCYNIGNTNDLILDQVTNTLNWGSEIDPWFLQSIDNSLYLNYWDDWVKTIYSLKQRKFTFNANLPPRYIEELSLNDRLIIGDQRYKINDWTLNLTTGDTKLTLFKDIYKNFDDAEPEFSGKVFAPAGMYLVDYTKANERGSYWLYGSFTSYDGQTATRVIKLNEDGTQDATFLTNLGGPNSNPFGTFSLAPYEDGRLLVGGIFTLYNGTARNRISRLNPNGTLDTTFSIGSGFNDFTSKVLLQEDGKILVGGRFTSYNGTGRVRLARLNSNGSLDTTLAIGSGFNNATLDAFQNEDGSYYVAGYFTQYNGNTANHIVKIGATGAIDNTFTTGATAFSPGGNNRVIGLLQDPNSASFWVYGYDFTSYQGATAGRIIKLTNTGSKDTNFDAGTGFNNSVISLRLTDSGNLFAGGEFTAYNGISTQKAIILSQSGDIIQTFPQTGLNNCYVVGNDVYANEASTGKSVKLTSQNTLNLTRYHIQGNAGSKYFGFGIFSNSNWTITKVDTGYGTSWVDVLTPSGTGNSEVSILMKEKASQTPPAVFEPRWMYLKVVSGNIEKWVKLYQTGL